MAIVSVGYPTDIGDTNIDWANMQRGLGRRYWVSSGVFVTASTTVARQVNISTGYFGAAGITDYNNSTATVTLPTVTSGTTKYFLVGAERNWNTGSVGTTFTYIDGGTSSATLPAFPKDGMVPGGSGIDFQPLAIVPVTGGTTAPGTPIDLRALTDGGNVFIARDERVLQYMTGFGTTVRIGDDVWTYHAFPSGWVKDKEILVSGPGYTNVIGLGGTSGWTTVQAQLSYARRSRISGWHQLRFAASRSGATLPFSATAGGFSDSTVANVNNVEFRPPYQLTAIGIYRHGSASYHCGVVFNPDGSIGITSGAPSTEISKRTDGDWSFRCNFEWMAA